MYIYILLLEFLNSEENYLYHGKRVKIKQDLNQRISVIPLSNRIGIILFLETLLLYVITADVEIFFILIFIGIIITRELTDLYTTHRYKKTLNFYIIIFLFTYGILISQKIIEILSN